MNLSLKSYKGTRDLYPSDMAIRKYIFDGWRRVVESYGYREYAAPILEPIDIYKAKSGEEIVSEQTYSFVDRGGRQVVIRPEMTPSVSRMVAARRQEMPMPARLYSIANFMRYERPQHGREREFWQLNFDMFGVDSLHGDAEIIELSHRILSYFGATDQMFKIKLGDRRLTNFIMHEYLNLGKDQSHRLIKLIDRYDKLPESDFRELAADIIGESGMERLMILLSVNNFYDLPKEILNSPEASSIAWLLTHFDNIGINNVVYDVRLMRGFDYYTGVVFEVFDNNPDNRRSLFGGGRYNGLIGLFGVDSLPVVGAAPGETTFLDFLRAHKLLPDKDVLESLGVMVIPVYGDDAVVVSVAASYLADKLRLGNINVAIDLTDRKVVKKTKSAVKAGYEWVIYIGDDEAKDYNCTIKNLVTGHQDKIKMDEAVSYFDHFYGSNR